LSQADFSISGLTITVTLGIESRMISKQSRLMTVLVAALGVGMYSGAQSLLTNGLIAYYPFNGSSEDASGNGFNGDITESCSYVPDRFGNPDYALFITNDQTTADPDTGRVSIPISTINGLTEGTISAWVNPQDVTSGDIVAKQHSGVNSYAIFSIGGYPDGGGQPQPGNPGTLYFHAQNSAPDAASTGLVSTGVWQQVVVVFSTNSCNFYINGILSGTNAGDFSIPDDLDCDSENIGCWTGDGFLSSQRLRFIGAIDDVRIYDRAFSADEVGRLYQIESSPRPGSPHVESGKAIYVEVNDLMVGYTYQLQMSANGKNWQDSGDPFTAIAKKMTVAYFKGDDHEHILFRVRQVP
jgi:hypothetical protein